MWSLVLSPLVVHWRIHKCIRGYCGEKPVPYDVVLPVEILRLACTSDMADELFCQLLKHLNDNPSAHSKRKVWELLLGAAICVSPSRELKKHIIQSLSDTPSTNTKARTLSVKMRVGDKYITHILSQMAFLKLCMHESDLSVFDCQKSAIHQYEESSKKAVKQVERILNSLINHDLSNM